MPDYAEAVARFEAFIRDAKHRQPGDPAALAGRIVELAATPSRPPGLVFGDDALAWAFDKVERLATRRERSSAIAAT